MYYFIKKFSFFFILITLFYCNRSFGYNPISDSYIEPNFAHIFKIILVIIIVTILLLKAWNSLFKKIIKQKTIELTNTIKQLENNENRIKTLFKALPDMLFVLSRNGIFIDYHSDNINDVSVPPNEFIGKSIVDIFTKELSSKFMKSINMLFKKNETQILEYSLELHREIRDFEARLVQYNKNNILVIVRDITEKKKLEAYIYEMSVRDSLTGINNRTYFKNELEKYEREEKDLSNFAIIICDVDGLKFVNDIFGHPVGDKYIYYVANIIRSCFRNNDIIARIGGDEFGILMKNTSPQQIEQIKLNIDKKLEETNKTKKQLVPFSISFGYAIYKNEYERDLAKMYKAADDNMYREKLHQRQITKNKSVKAFMEMLETRDFITKGHGNRMEQLSVKLAKSISMSNSKINDIGLLAKFHDIGKVGISDDILFKTDTLDETETLEIRKHTEIGYRIATSLPKLMHIGDLIFKHHEWWNGQGYPFGLKGEEIPIECRIISIVDAYDAMTNDRPYRKAFKKEVAIEELKKYSGIQFDPDLVAKFIDILDEK